MTQPSEFYVPPKQPSAALVGVPLVLLGVGLSLAGALTPSPAALLTDAPPATDESVAIAASQAREERPNDEGLLAVQERNQEGCQITFHAADDVSNVWVDLYRMNSDGTQEVLGGALIDGHRRFASIRAGTWQITARAPGHALLAPPAFHCEANMERGFYELRFASLGTEVVAKVSGHGALQGAEVLVEQPAGFRNALAGVAHIALDDKGHFTTHLQPGRYRILAVADHHTARFVDVNVGNTKLVSTIRLTWSPEAVGRVIDAKGQPVQGAKVFLGPVLNPKLGFTSVTTDAQGHFNLPVLAGRGLLATAWHPSFGTASVALGAPKGVAGYETGDVVLKAGRNAGGAVFEKGRLRPFAQVTFRIKELGMTGTAKANKQGRFLIHNLPFVDVEFWPKKGAIGAWGGAVSTVSAPGVMLRYVVPAYKSVK